MDEQVLMEMIAEQNDRFRQRTNRIKITDEVERLGGVWRLVSVIRHFDDFNYETDPEGSHDFGVVQWRGELVAWSILYYHRELDEWADPLGRDCVRVLSMKVL